MAIVDYVYSEKEKEFCRQYAASGKTIDSYLGAGYALKTKKSMHSTASRLLRKTKIKELIDYYRMAEHKKNAHKVGLTKIGLCKILAQHCKGVLTDFIDCDGEVFFDEDTPNIAALRKFGINVSMTGVTKRIELTDPVKSGHLLAELMGWKSDAKQQAEEETAREIRKMLANMAAIEEIGDVVEYEEDEQPSEDEEEEDGE